MGWFDWMTGGSDPQQEAAERQEQLKSDAVLIMQLLSRQSGMGGMFGSSPEIDRLIANNGGNTVVDNLLLQSKNNVVSGYAQAAQDADQATLNKTVYNALLASRRMAGVGVNAEERAQFREQARHIGNSMPMVIGLMKSMGMDTSLMENAINATYGAKGSTQYLYNQAVPALSRFVGTTKAAQLSGHLVAGQYGAAWDANRVGGISASDLGATINFMSKNGGYNRQQLLHGGFGLSNMGVQARSIARAGLTGIDAEEALHATYDKKAVEMAGSIFATEQKLAGDASILYSSFDSEYQKMVKGENDIDKRIKDANTKYGMNINIDKRGDTQAGVQAIEAEFNKAIEKAEKAKNEKLAQQLKDEMEEAVEAVQAFFAPSGKTDKYGKVLTYAELAEKRSIKEREVGTRLVQGTVLDMQHRLYEITRAREEALHETDHAKRATALKNVRQMELEFEQYKNENSLTRAAATVIESNEAMERTLDIARMGSDIQAAYKQQGKDITQADALAASRAMAGGSLSGMDTRRFAKEVGKTIHSVVAAGGDLDAMFKRGAAFQEFARSRGVKNELAAGVGMFAERGLGNYLQNGMGDEEAAQQVARDQQNMIAMANSELMRGIRGVEHLLGQNGPYTERMKKGATEEELAILEKIRTHRNLTEEDYQTAAPLLNNLLRRAYTDDRGNFNASAMNNMLNTAKQSDYATQQLNRYANADYYWRGSTKYQDALDTMGFGGLTGKGRHDAWSLMLQQADDIERLVGMTSDGSIMGKEELYNKQKDLASKIAIQLQQNKSTEDLGNALIDEINAHEKDHDLSNVIQFFTGINEAREQTGLTAQAAKAKTERESTVKEKESIEDRLDTIRKRFPTFGTKKVKLDEVFEMAAKSTKGARAKAFAEAFGYTDPEKLREQMGEEALVNMADAIILHGEFTANAPHTGLHGERLTFSQEQIEAMQYFAAHPEFMQLSEDEARDRVWHRSIDGNEDIRFADVGRWLQQARGAVLAENGMASLGLTGLHSTDYAERANSSEYKRRVVEANRRKYISEHQSEVNTEKKKLLNDGMTKSEYDTLVKDKQSQLVMSEMGDQLVKINEWLAEEGDLSDAEKERRKSNAEKWKKKKETVKENEEADYQAKRENIIQRRDEQLKLLKDDGSAEYELHRTRIYAMAGRELAELEGQYDYDKDTKKHYSKSLTLNYKDLMHSKAGYHVYDTFTTAKKVLQDKIDRGEALTKEEENRLAYVNSVLEQMDAEATVEAEAEVAKPVESSDYLFSEEALDPSKYRRRAPVADGMTLDEIRSRKEAVERQLEGHGWNDTFSWMYDWADALTLGAIGSWYGADPGRTYREGESYRKELFRLEDMEQKAMKDVPDKKATKNVIELEKKHSEFAKKLAAARGDHGKMLKLSEEYADEIMKYGVHTGDYEEALELLNERYEYEQGNYIASNKEGEFKVNTGPAGIQVGTYEGAKWYKEMKVKEANDELTDEDKADMRAYEERLAKYIKTHPLEFVGSGVSVTPPAKLETGITEPIKEEDDEVKTHETTDDSYVEVDWNRVDRMRSGAFGDSRYAQQDLPSESDSNSTDTNEKLVGLVQEMHDQIVQG